MSWKQFPCISWKLRTEEQRDVCLCFLQVSALREVCAAEAEGCLVKEAKKWATKAAKDYKIITHGERVTLWFLKFEDQDTHEQSFLLVTSMSKYFCEWIRSNWIGMFFSETNNKRSICVNSTLIRNVMYISAMFLHQALQTLESRLKLLSGETGLSVEQKIAEVQDSVRKAKVLFLIGLFHSGNRKIRVFTVFFFLCTSIISQNCQIIWAADDISSLKTFHAFISMHAEKICTGKIRKTSHVYLYMGGGKHARRKWKYIEIAAAAEESVTVSTDRWRDGKR